LSTQIRNKVKVNATKPYTSFSHISINSLTILTVIMAPRSPYKALFIDTSHISRQSIMTEISGKSVGIYHGTVY